VTLQDVELVADLQTEFFLVGNVGIVGKERLLRTRRR
jgi:hypothetical protein